MGARRALIVDDSKSARAFLSRILEKYDIDVDTAESAEHAIEYLGHHRPDVIFMDHLMPGMDGFQAVQAIKNNPRTAMIPIMMYTSQEGELYLGQARALGAIGVLPKQIRPADVSKVLYQLHLLPDRRTADQASFHSIEGAAANDASEPPPAIQPPTIQAPPLVPPSMMPGPVTDAVMREQFADLRRTLIASLETQTDRLSAEMRSLLQEMLPPPPLEPPPARRPWALMGVGAAAVAAIVLAAASTALWWREADERQALLTELNELRDARVSPMAKLRSAPVSSQTVEELTGDDNFGARISSLAGARPVVEAVPYGAEPLGGPRLEALRQLFDRLIDEDFRGAVEIRTFPGRFCLIGNSAEGYSLPPDETPFSRCDVADASEDVNVPPRVPLAFANLVSEFRKSTRGQADVVVLPGDPAATIVPYPPVSESLTAGEWNRAGSANSRIEIRIR